MRQLELVPTQSWQQLLAEGFTCPQQLLNYLQIPLSALPFSLAAHQQFKTKVPKGFAAKMRQGDIHDPLLQQVLPLAAEDILTSGYSADPLAEQQANPVKGLLHKYYGRVLFILSSSCAINCRYCFRRHFPYKLNNPGHEGWDDAFYYIKQHPEINEIILSGGEPLLLNDASLAKMISKIKELSQIKILRFHTRMPIVLPERITPQFVALLAHSGLRTVMVMHCNHPQELDDIIAQKMQMLRHAGVHLFNQTVILKSVNANQDILCRLSYRLFDLGIIPYYLHVLDKAQATAHFAVELNEVHAIYQAMQAQLPGYLLPRLVQEVAGALSKTPLFN